jgi:ATP-dependent Clp protease ATP-binding subunit ClpB
MIQQMAGDDYQVIKLAVMAEVKTYFRPEFINRIDEVVVFHALDERNIKSIARIQLGYLEKRLAAMDMRLEVDDSVLEELVKIGFDPVYGARPLKRAIQQTVENPLAREILEGHFGPKDVIRVSSSAGKPVFTRAHEAESSRAKVAAHQ